MPTNPNSQARDVTVNVFVHQGGPNGDFHFETTDLPMGPDNHLYFSNCNHPGFNVTYVLQTAGYTFLADCDDACWVHPHSGCPTSKSQWGQFKPWNSAGNSLTIYNKNASKADFAYALNVQKNGAPLCLDPGATNYNGPGRSSSSALLAVVGGAVAGSLLTLGVQAMLS